MKKMKKTQFPLFLLLFLVVNVYSQNIVINEISSENTKYYSSSYPESLKNNRDYIELKNKSFSPIDISGYFLSNDPKATDKWAFPKNTIIPANGFLLILPDGSGMFSRYELFANFTLSTSGGTVVLSGVDGAEIDRVEYPPLLINEGYGRLSDGSLSRLSTLTPEQENIDSSGFAYIDVDITTSIPSGVYKSAQVVEITKTGKGQIYYTTDGTAPSSSSTQYTTPITISKHTNLKIRAIESPSSYSLIKNKSYIIGATHNLPIIVITADNTSSRTGYDGVSKTKNNINGKIDFKFIEKDGTVVIDQYADFRASGKTSRSLPQLNGKIKANKAYGDNDFDYKMYPDKEINSFKSFLLRNASQDWYNAHMRDAFISKILGQNNLSDIPFEAYRPAVLYVNAKYQGIINVREDDDNDYIRHNFGLKSDEFTKEDFSLVPSVPAPTNREELEKQYSFNDDIIRTFLISYSVPQEWGFGTWYDLSGKTPHISHTYMHDFDFTFGGSYERAELIEGPMDLASIIQVDEAYKKEATQFVAAAINHIFNEERTIGILNAMEKKLESEIPAHATAMAQLAIDYGAAAPNYTNLTEWKENVEILRKNIKGRFKVPTIFTRIQKEYKLDAPIQVTYASSDINNGFVRVHNVKSVTQTFTGTYFKNSPIHLTAEALPGYRFVRWEGDALGTNEKITPVFSKNASVKAVFEPITIGSINLVINEVQGKNDTTIADEEEEFDDWIEIYNPTDTPVNLAGYYISDNTGEPLKWKIPNTDASKTTVAGKGYLLLWADKDLSQGANHLDFKLKGTDNVVLTAPDASTLVQQISFTEVAADSSYGAKTDGNSEYVIFETPTPNATNSAVALSINTANLEIEKFSVYPNPTTNKITITKGLDKSSNFSWTLYDIAGNVIYKGNKTEISLQNVTAGLYFLNFNNSTTIKIIKK